MKKLSGIIAAVMLALAMSAGTASAATTTAMANPTPNCPVFSLSLGPECTCPPGWHVVWPPWYYFGFGRPSCAANKR